MNELFFLPASALVSFAGVYLYKKIAEEKKFAIGVDINKASQPRIAEGAGIVLLLPLWGGVLLCIALGGSYSLILWAILISCFSFIGFFDDLRHKFLSKAMPWLKRAVPVAVLSTVFALLHSLNPIWIIVLALFVAGIASLQNTFAGLNGWEVGSGFIISICLALALSGSWLYAPALLLCGSIAGLLAWNAFPARVFPGDAGTMLIGSAMAGLVVMSGRIEWIVLLALFFLPHAVDFFVLKMLTNPRDASQCRLRPYRLLGDGRLAIPEYSDGRTRYDFAKLLLRIFGPLNEKLLVLLIWIVVAVNCLLWLVVFNKL